MIDLPVAVVAALLLMAWLRWQFYFLYIDCLMIAGAAFAAYILVAAQIRG